MKIRDFDTRCERCRSYNGTLGFTDYGSVNRFYCKDCRHTTVFFSITPKGEEVLRLLLGESKDEDIST